MKITVYSKGGCPFCSLLKMELAKRGLTYAEVDLSDDSNRARFYQETGHTTVPQVYLANTDGEFTYRHGQSFGGWTQVSKDWASLINSMTT